MSANIFRWSMLALGWVFGLGLLMWLLRHVDLPALTQPAQLIDPISWLFATIIWLLSFVFRAWRVQQEWAWRKRVGLGVALRLILLHNAAVLLLPFRSGEAGYPLLVKKVFGAPLGMALRSLGWLRVQDACVLALLGLLLWPGTPPWLMWLAPSALVGLVLLPARWWLHWLRRRAWWAKALRRVLHRRATRAAWLLALANWVCKLGVVAMLLGQLLPLTFWTGLQAALGGELASLLPLQGPAGLGTYEAGVWVGAGLTSAPTQAVAAAALLVHVFCLAVSLGASALAWLLLKWPAEQPAAAIRENTHHL
jgi:hypothetical protein